MLFKLKSFQTILMTLSILLWSASVIAQDAHVAPSVPMACPSVLEGKPFTGVLVTLSDGLVSASGRCFYSGGVEYELTYKNKNAKPPVDLTQFPLSSTDVNKLSGQWWQRTSLTGYQFSCGNAGSVRSSPAKPQECLLVFDGKGLVEPAVTVSVQPQFLGEVPNDINSNLKFVIQCYDSVRQSVACNTFDQNIQVGFGQILSDGLGKIQLNKEVKTMAVNVKGSRHLSIDKSCANLPLNPSLSTQAALILSLHTELDSERVTQVGSMACAMGVVS